MQPTLATPDCEAVAWGITAAGKPVLLGLEPDELGPKNPFENAFSAKARLLESEKQACSSINVESARTWKIVNPNVLNALGEPVGYKFFAGDNVTPCVNAPTAQFS